MAAAKGGGGKKRVNTGPGQRTSVSARKKASPTKSVSKAARGTTKVHTSPAKKSVTRATTTNGPQRTRIGAAGGHAATAARALGGTSVGPVRVGGHEITVSGRVHQPQTRSLHIRFSARHGSVSLAIAKKGDTKKLLAAHARGQHRDSHGRFS